MDNDRPTPPPAMGVRRQWLDLPMAVRARVEQWLDTPVLQATPQPSGFSPGVAARLDLADGRRVFCKAVSAVPNPQALAVHRRERDVLARLPHGLPVPQLLWAFEHEGSDGAWVVLLIEHVEGRLPQQPWCPDEVHRVLQALAALSAALTPSPIPTDLVGTAGTAVSSSLNGWKRLRNQGTAQRARLDTWAERHLDTLVALEERAVEAVAGTTLLHFDLRADNLLLDDEQVWFVDWPHARVGAAWLDAVFLAPSVTMQGGPPPEALLSALPQGAQIPADDLTAAVAAMAGFFTHGALQPAPPGLPTLRAFQAAQGEVARAWLSQRIGWR